MSKDLITLRDCAEYNTVPEYDFESKEYRVALTPTKCHLNIKFGFTL